MSCSILHNVAKASNASEKLQMLSACISFAFLYTLQKSNPSAYLSPPLWASSIRKNCSESGPNNTEEKASAESCPTTMHWRTQSVHAAEPPVSCSYRNVTFSGHVSALAKAKWIWKLTHFRCRKGRSHVSRLDCCRVVALELNYYL